MTKAEQRAMQVIARISGERTAVGCRNSPGFIQRIADQRMPGSGEMYSYLVGTAGGDHDFKQCATVAPLQHSDMAVRRPAIGRGRVDSLQDRVGNRADRDVYIEFVFNRTA